VSHHQDVTSCVSVNYTYSYLTTTGKKGGGKRSLEERGLMPADSAVALVGSADGTVSVWPIHLPGIAYGGSEVGAKGGGAGVTSVTQTAIGNANANGILSGVAFKTVEGKTSISSAKGPKVANNLAPFTIIPLSVSFTT